MTGGWLMFGPLLGSLIADICCGCTQLQYVPAKYGQYFDISTNRIWTIRNTALLASAYKNGALVDPEIVTFAARQDPSNSLFHAASTAMNVQSHWPLSCFALAPGIHAILALVVMVWGGERYWRSPGIHCLEAAG